MFSILIYFLELNLFKFLWKKLIIFALNTKYQKYRVQFIRPLFKKRNKFKKSNIPFSYYAILFLLSKVWQSLMHLGHQFEKIFLTKFSLLEIVLPKFLGVL